MVEVLTNIEEVIELSNDPRFLTGVTVVGLAAVVARLAYPYTQALLSAVPEADPNIARQKKPMELLGALIAKGANGADRSLLAQELWPDSEGDSAESALRMAVHRLRKILKNDDAVITQDSRIQLDAKIVWVDAWALEHACANVPAIGEGSGEASADPEAANSLFDLYQGPAFGRDAPQPWMLPAVERWRAKFVAAVKELAERETRRGTTASAATLYKRALDVDPLSEEIYQNLITCHLEQGNFAEAYNVYRRCREMLSVALGIHPSSKTELLRERIVAQGMDGSTSNL